MDYNSSTNFPGPVTVMGVPVVSSFPTAGNIYFLDPQNGNDGYEGTSVRRAFKTLPYAYSKLTANQHDILYYLAGPSSITLSVAFEWAKNYTHFIGVTAPSSTAQRARIFQLATATGLSPLFKVSATGCRFENFYIFQGVDDATSLIDFQVTGGRNRFYNIHFAGGGHATQAIDGGASLHMSGAEENEFERCTIGVDTIAAGNGMAGLVYAATGGAARNTFRNCRFRLKAGNAGAIFVELLGNSGLDRDQEFVDCRFINLAATQMTEAFAVDAGFDSNDKRILLYDCNKIGATKWDSGSTGMIYGNMNIVSGADNSGGLVQMVT